MAFNDPISELLTRIRNACMAKHRYVDLPYSKAKEAVLKILKQQGFVENFLIKDKECKGTIRVFLKYTQGQKPVIHGLKRISKPSVRKYVGYKDIPYVLGGMGISVMSTSKGVMEGEEARKNKAGGEVLCYVW